MATITDDKDQVKRYAAVHGYSGNGFMNNASSMLGPYSLHGNVPAMHAASLYPAMQVNNGNDAMTAFAHRFGSMNLHQPSVASSLKTSFTPGSQMSAATEYSGVPMNQGNQLYLGGQQQVVFPGTHNLHGRAPGLAGANHGMPQTPSAYNAMGNMMSNTYGGYSQAMLNGSPYGANWTPRAGANDVPTLYTPRRDSLSSNENDTPNTPFANYMYGGYQNNAVAVVDRSPSYTHSGTPSPSQLAGPYSMPLVKVPPAIQVSPEIQALVQQHPAIPPAIPAPSSPLKPLDRSLENKNGETNVYIRGLQPETTDEILHGWGARFGDIQSSKSIIDMKTNLCKGYLYQPSSRLLKMHC